MWIQQLISDSPGNFHKWDPKPKRICISSQHLVSHTNVLTAYQPAFWLRKTTYACMVKLVLSCKAWSRIYAFTDKRKCLMKACCRIHIDQSMNKAHMSEKRMAEKNYHIWNWNSRRIRLKTRIEFDCACSSGC